ncbi:MAG: hypothetical protein K0R06_3382, partial [Clostridium sp.]|nr:hypothetical protein [Clostridium sp.]
NLVNKKLKTIEDVKDICGDCRWTEKCLWHLNRECIFNGTVD